MKLNKLFFGLAAMAALTFTACSDDDIDYQRGKWDANATVQGEGFADIYFSNPTPSVELDPLDECTATLEVYRRVVHEYKYEKDSNDKDSLVSDSIITKLPAMTVKFEVTENTDNVFTVGDAQFAEGDTVATFTVNFPTAEVGKPYVLGLNITDPSLVSANYSNADYCTFTINRVKWNDVGFYFDENGNKVEGWAMFTDDYITSFFGVENVSYPIKVQERDDRPGYFRLLNVYGESYPYNDPGDWDDSQDYYIYIDATDPKKVTIPERCNLGLDWGYGEFSIWSLAGYYLARDNEASAEANYGTYANGKITFPVGGLLISMANYNNGGLYSCNDAGLWTVVIDPTLNPYRADVLTDFDYAKEFEGVLISELRGTSTTATLYKGTANNTTDDCDSVFAATYGTPYYIESPYAEGYNILFAAKDNGEVTIPEGYELQPIGLDDNAGHDIYAKVSTLSTYEENYLKLIVTFQSEDGSLVYGSNLTEVVANLTYTEVGTGVYTYGAGQLSDGAESFYEGTENATLYQCDQIPGNFYLKPWAMSEDGLQFTVQPNNAIKFYQSTGETFQDYGEVYFIDIEAYNPAYTDYLGEYDADSGTFEFSGAYVIPGVGGFGLVIETFELNASAANAVKASVKKAHKLQSKFKGAPRFVGKKVQKQPKQLKNPVRRALR